MRFLVISLPRSRSTWLSCLLSQGSARCGHDLMATCGGLDRLRDAFAAVDGSCETGGALSLPLARQWFDGLRVALVRRPVADVQASMERFLGLTLADPASLARLDARLDALARAGVPSWNFADLASEAGCASLFEHCLGRPLESAWWQQWAPLQIQPMAAPWKAMLLRESPHIAHMKTTLEAL